LNRINREFNRPTSDNRFRHWTRHPCRCRNFQWHSWKNAKVAIVDNPRAKEMMNDAAAVTLDEIR